MMLLRKKGEEISEKTQNNVYKRKEGGEGNQKSVQCHYDKPAILVYMV